MCSSDLINMFDIRYRDIDTRPRIERCLDTDDTYRVLIRAKIGANHWDGTLGTSAAILDQIFDNGTNVFIQDNQDMTMTFGVSGAIPSAVLLALLKGGYIPLKPEGVLVNSYIVTSSTGASIFGFVA